MTSPLFPYLASERRTSPPSTDGPNDAQPECADTDAAPPLPTYGLATAASMSYAATLPPANAEVGSSASWRGRVGSGELPPPSYAATSRALSNTSTPPPPSPHSTAAHAGMGGTWVRGSVYDDDVSQGRVADYDSSRVANSSSAREARVQHARHRQPRWVYISVGFGFLILLAIVLGATSKLYGGGHGGGYVYRGSNDWWELVN